MKKLIISLVMVIAVFFSAPSLAFVFESADIKANSFISEEYVFNDFGCSGKNISPELSWYDIPKDTKSLALTVYDPDAPTGSGWWHWVVVNIPVKYSSLKKDFGVQNSSSMQDGIMQIRNDFGKFSYGGPCPPMSHRAHRYIFTLYALKVEKLEIPQDATAALAGFFINQNLIKKTSFQAKYQR